MTIVKTRCGRIEYFEMKVTLHYGLYSNCVLADQLELNQHG